MERISYKKIRGLINNWNTAHPEKQFEISAYNGYYHLGEVGDNGCIKSNLIVEKYPGRLWESFCLWRSGYFDGRDSMRKEMENND